MARRILHRSPPADIPEVPPVFGYPHDLRHHGGDTDRDMQLRPGRRKIPFSFHETRGSGLTQRAKYISRSLGEQFTVPERLHHLATVRHCIAHASGDLLDWSHRPQVEKAAQELGLQIVPDRIAVPSEACAPLAQAALDWLNGIVAAVDPTLWSVR